MYFLRIYVDSIVFNLILLIRDVQLSSLKFFFYLVKSKQSKSVRGFIIELLLFNKVTVTP